MVYVLCKRGDVVGAGGGEGAVHVAQKGWAVEAAQDALRQVRRDEGCL